MAMVKVEKIFPSKNELELLKRTLTTNIDVPVIKSGDLGSSLYLYADSNVLKISSFYKSISFKFEVFGLRWQEISSPPGSPTQNFILKNINQIRFLLTHYWQRPAKPGEVPQNFDSVIGNYGKNNEIEDEAFEVTACVTGVLFLNANHQLLAIRLSDEDPISLLYDIVASMESLGKRYDIVDFDELLQWVA
jgi:hypothetical protein